MSRDLTTKNNLKFRPKVYLPVIAIAIFGIFLLIPEIFTLLLGHQVSILPLSNLTYTEKINILLTFALVIFAQSQANTTQVQVYLDEKKNMIMEARNELENAYGPIYSILYRSRKGEKSLRVSQDDFKTIDRIIAVYPWVFSEEIRDLWNETRRPIPSISLEELQKGQTEHLNDVSFKFRDKINEEYKRRIENYEMLLGKT